MDLRIKLSILADAAKYDASCASSGAKGRRTNTQLGSTEGMGICHSYTPDGRCISLLKILLTNYCIYDCHFCVNRITSEIPRARFTVEEVVRLTIEFYKRNYIEGLFLSSGIIQSVEYTMEQLIAVARSLRQDHRFGGYIHLKLIPGASDELIREAGLWADRLSANIELPTQSDLQRLAPDKKQETIVGAMREVRQSIEQIRADQRAGLHVPRFAPAGQSTQMVIGATPTPDRIILQTAAELYRDQQLRRVYFSAYSPTPHADPRLPSGPPPLIREHRLYQADWLLRFYGFDVREMATDADGNLPLDIDPKLAWAIAHRERFPVDVNTAPRELLLRIPGVGVRNVERILRIRKHHRLTSTDLQRLRVVWRSAAPFVITADSNPGLKWLDRVDLRQRVRPKNTPGLFDDLPPEAPS